MMGDQGMGFISYSPFCLHQPLPPPSLCLSLSLPCAESSSSPFTAGRDLLGLLSFWLGAESMDGWSFPFFPHPLLCLSLSLSLSLSVVHSKFPSTHLAASFAFLFFSPSFSQQSPLFHCCLPTSFSYRGGKILSTQWMMWVTGTSLMGLFTLCKCASLYSWARNWKALAVCSIFMHSPSSLSSSCSGMYRDRKLLSSLACPLPFLSAMHVWVSSEHNLSFFYLWI